MAGTTQFILETAFGGGVANAGFTLANFNSLAAGSCVVSATAITAAGNTTGTGVDPYVDISFSFIVGGTTVAGDFIAVYALPLNQDGSTYGDGSASGATLPAAGYQVGAIGVRAGITSGSTITGTVRGMISPIENYKLVIANRTSVAFNASAAAAVSYVTYRENLNA